MSYSAFQPPEISELQKLLPSLGIEEFIAAGGMGAVYRARQLSLDREVAVKILPAEFLADGDMRTQFGEEARAMAKLNHANLISIYDFGEVQGMPYLVMEYVSGNSLHDSSHGVAIDPEVALSIAGGIAEGLAHAHAAGIIHRDIKPANILLTEDVQPKIGDFGLARPLETGNAGAIVFGTPGYTAPEVLSNPDSVGKQSDVFSVGVILYELLTGALPGDPMVPASRKVRTPGQLDQVIRKATHPDPSQRYPDAAALAADLAKVAPLLKKATLLTAGGVPGGGPTALATGTAGATPTSPVSTTTLQSAGATNWAFLRNLVIIVVLCGAIFGVWKVIGWKQAVTEKREREHRQKVARKEQERDAGEQAKPPVSPDPDPDPDPAPPVPEKSPLEQLAALRDELRAGERSELPEGTHTQGGQAYFVVEKDLTWAEAAAFAEEHGGHLAVSSDSTLTTFLAGKVPAGRKAWVGAGLTGPNYWGWVDGTKWSGKQLSRQLGNVLALSYLGTLLPMDASNRLPFVLQWDLGGGNPGTLDLQLKRMEDTADTPNPVWPVGAVHSGTRHYLLIPRKVGLDEAADLAREMGGHLAVPSDSGENDFLLEIAGKLQAAGEACWIGGQYSGGEWRWLTGEDWTKAFWSEGFPGENPARGTGLCLRAGTGDGWVASRSDQDRPTSFLVEWSPDHTYATGSAVDFDFVATEELLKLRAIALNAYQKHEDQFGKDLGNNRKDFLWDLDFWFNGIPGSQRERFEPGLRIFKARFDVADPNTRLVVDFDLGEVPEEVRDILAKRLEKEDQIEAAFEARVEKLRLAYLNQLTTKISEFQEAGNGREVAAFKNEASALGQDGAAAREYFEFLK